MKAKITTLIVDLDNTLYDWFSVWAASFEPIYKGLVSNLSVEQERIDSEIRKIHQAKRTSEYTFLLDELPFTTQGGRSLRDILKEPIAESKARRDRALRLYPTVLKTLWSIKNNGTLIVGYTESLAFYSGYRLKRLGLDGVLDYLYTPEDNDLPKGVSLEKVRSYPDEFYELQITQVRHTPADELKPNPRLLRKIIEDLKLNPQQCAYVGDSLFKDVAMAQDAGVHDVYAEYGISQQHELYDLLRRVSHWTNEAIQKERDTTRRAVEPTLTIEYFGEILTHFEFESFAVGPSEASISDVIDIWKKVVDVQQHFNDIEIKIRNYALTVIGAIMAAAGITFKDNITSRFLGFELPTASLVATAAIFVWLGFWFMDKHWYHRLLKGAVNHAILLENKYGQLIPEISLGAAIAQASPFSFFGLKIDSNRKINIFYGLGSFVIFMFILFTVLSQSAPHADLRDALIWTDPVFLQWHADRSAFDPVGK